MVERGIWIGKPDAYTIDTNGNENYMGGSFTFQRQVGARGEFSVFSNASNVSYNFSGPNNVGWWQINQNTVEVDISFPGTHTFTAEFSNDCGTHYYFVLVNITDSFSNFRVAPNPTTDSFSIYSVNVTNDRASEAVTEDVSYELYDLNSVLKLRGDLRNSRSVNVYGLKKGLYILKLISKSEVEYHRILIE